MVRLTSYFLLLLPVVVALEHPPTVYYVGGLEVSAVHARRLLVAPDAQVLATHVHDTMLGIADDFRAIAQFGLSQNNTAHLIAHLQGAPKISVDEAQRIWVDANTVGHALYPDVLVNGSLAIDLQNIAKNGLNQANGANLLSNTKRAIAIGAIVVQDGATVLNDIRSILEHGANLKNGMSTVTSVQKLLQDVSHDLDLKPKVCRRVGASRGVGQPVVTQCLPGEEAYGALCYPKCKEGYEAVGCCICCKKGCSGLQGSTDIGVSCSKPAAYGRGAGYALWNEDKCKTENAQGCEKNGAMWYPKCEKGFHNVGCCICSPDCPAGTIDNGVFCRKDAYGRGAGVSRIACPAGLEMSGLLCYPPCAASQMGVGPLCWPRCITSTCVDCGLFCTSSVPACVGTTVDIVGATAKISLSMVGQDFTGAFSTAVRVGGKYLNMTQCGL